MKTIFYSYKNNDLDDKINNFSLYIDITKIFELLETQFIDREFIIKVHNIKISFEIYINYNKADNTIISFLLYNNNININELELIMENIYITPLFNKLNQIDLIYLSEDIINENTMYFINKE